VRGEPSEIHEAPGWALLGLGLAALPFALLLAMADVLQGAAVRGACAAMRAARGERL
jgi:hypothetical protein